MLNKVLKDVIVRSRTMAGFDAPYVPGWDCHGLPIELKVDQELGGKKRHMSVADFRRACRRYAQKFVDRQSADFQRLGVLGDWDRPYRTMTPDYQAAIVRALGRFVEQRVVYKGKKPVHWCLHCRTALAEAEVEYEDHTSPSIYVEFPMREASAAALAEKAPAVAGRPVSVLIWTTTPWTIPSNLAVAFHPGVDYGVYAADGGAETHAGDERGGAVIIAEKRRDATAAALGRDFGPPLATLKGRDLEGATFGHPLYDRDSVGVLADYVTLEQGTGAVHTAPGHGADDYATGVRYGLDVHAPIGPSGRFDDDVEIVGGQKVFDANPTVEAALADAGRLWHRDTVDHTYPHCWRCHHPVIFLATWQWFIGLDTGGLRGRALSAIRGVEWFPEWGEERIRNMLANRPDWCISRQRSWGGPDSRRLLRRVPRGGADDGADRPGRRGLRRARRRRVVRTRRRRIRPPGPAVPRVRGGRVRARARHSRRVVRLGIEPRRGARRPSGARLALQRLSGRQRPVPGLVPQLAAGRPRHPQRRPLPSGDHPRLRRGRVGPQDVEVDRQHRRAPDDHPAERGRDSAAVVAMVDYREEVRIGPHILDRIVEAYRKIRNTLRILAANLYDFDPAAHAVPRDELLEVDRYALARYGEVAARVLRAYERYELQTVVRTVNNYLTVDISAFYVDVLKDRLYTLGPRAHGRRSAQTALHAIAGGITRLLAPILPMTCDELWRHLPGADADSVHLADFPAEPESLVDPDLIARWTRLLGLRDAVNGELEKLRQDKVVGTSLEAAVTLTADGGVGRPARGAPRRPRDAVHHLGGCRCAPAPRPAAGESGALCIGMRTGAPASRSAGPTAPSARGAGAG